MELSVQTAPYYTFPNLILYRIELELTRFFRKITFRKYLF